jgi:two-component system, sensor histidine kinase and response regulator
VILVVIELPDKQQFLLATLPPSRGQSRLALGVGVALVVSFAITVPITTTQLAAVDAFIPALQIALLTCDLITAAMLFAQFSIVRSRSLLTLASGYLFTAFIARRLEG